MNESDCILCGHPHGDHHGQSCHGGTFFSTCACTWVEQPPLAASAGVEEHRARSDWWDEQARASWDMALRSRDDLDRWYPLMRFHRVARRAEIDHRLYALSLERSPGSSVAPLAVPAPSAVVLVAPAEPVMPLPRRLQLASIA